MVSQTAVFKSSSCLFSISTGSSSSGSFREDQEDENDDLRLRIPVEADHLSGDKSGLVTSVESVRASMAIEANLEGGSVGLIRVVFELSVIGEFQGAIPRTTPYGSRTTYPIFP